jgi:hypothetical protein
LHLGFYACAVRQPLLRRLLLLLLLRTFLSDAPLRVLGRHDHNAIFISAEQE